MEERMTDRHLGAALLARAYQILGKPPETEDELVDALRKADAERDAAPLDELELRVRALELQAEDPALDPSVARLTAELEAELVSGVELPHPDEVERVAASIAEGRGTTIAAITDEKQLAALYSDAGRQLVGGRSS